MSIDEFVSLYPGFAIDFGRQLRERPRVYDVDVLSTLPVELEPWRVPPKFKRRGVVNPNQTLTHYQCVSCNKVLRNDLFHMPPSLRAANRVFSYCKNCYVVLNAAAYDAHAEAIEARRLAVWRYLAPSCVACGFNTHSSAMDLHHLKGSKEHQMSDLITRFTLAPNPHNAERLLVEANKCIPLCANCHRLLHAGVLVLDDVEPLRYTFAGLLNIVKDVPGL
jgi:hypothetical protein